MKLHPIRHEFLDKIFSVQRRMFRFRSLSAHLIDELKNLEMQLETGEIGRMDGAALVRRLIETAQKDFDAVEKL